MKDYKYRITINVEPDGEGYYSYCPGLPGVFACGATEEEAIQNAKDGAKGILLSKIRFGDEITENPDLKKIDSKHKHDLPGYSNFNTQITIPHVACI
ncbi:hypothetical protein ES703_125298 [subsurface metagenome]